MRNFQGMPAALLVSAVLTAAGSLARAETPAAVADGDAVIVSFLKAQSEAWNRGDAKAFAKDFAEDGSFVNIVGDLRYGREAFEQQHAKIFSTIYQGSVLKETLHRVHFSRADVAIVDVDVELSGMKAVPPAVRLDADGVMRTRLMEVLVKKQGVWMIEAYHNVVIAVPPAK